MLSDLNDDQDLLRIKSSTIILSVISPYSTITNWKRLCSKHSSGCRVREI